MYCHCCSVVQSFPTLHNSMDCSMPDFPVPHHLPEFAQVHVHCIGDAIQPSHPLMPSSPSALDFLSVRDFSNESSVCIRWPKYWSFSFSMSPSSEYSGLISLKIDWFDLLAIQGTFSGVFSSTTSLYAPPQFIAPPYLWLSTTCQSLLGLYISHLIVTTLWRRDYLPLIALEYEMAKHSSILAWKIPQTEEPGGLLHRVTKIQKRLSSWAWTFFFFFF